MKGSPARSGGLLASKPTWRSPHKGFTTSAFFATGDRAERPIGGIDARKKRLSWVCPKLKVLCHDIERLGHGDRWRADARRRARVSMALVAGLSLVLPEVQEDFVDQPFSPTKMHLQYQCAGGVPLPGVFQLEYRPPAGLAV